MSIGNIRLKIVDGAYAKPCGQTYSKRRKNYQFSYANKKHAQLPHVVKFSGGRSSGMLLFVLLNSDFLRPHRRDVVIFNNTSAEHPATYDFVAECKRRCEGQYGVPFFLTEFQTYEDAVGGVYKRRGSYKLVNDKPYSEENPNGYHHKGEVFEELISWQGYLPNMFKRTCTSWMKLQVSKEFLKNWLSGFDGIDRLGHFGDASRIDLDASHENHLKCNGETPKDIYLAKKEYCFSRPLSRDAQLFSDYASVDEGSIRKPISKTSNGVEYCSFIGFRADESHRLAKLRGRSFNDASPEERRNESHSYIPEPDGEHIYAPLIEIGIKKENVISYWGDQDWDLGLPKTTGRSNCVYCFLKSSRTLLDIAQNERHSAQQELTPANLQWWIKLEQKYQRDLKAEKRNITSKNGNSVVGFFGTSNRYSYSMIDKLKAKIALLPDDADKKIELAEHKNLPCDCTD